MSAVRPVLTASILIIVIGACSLGPAGDAGDDALESDAPADTTDDAAAVRTPSGYDEFGGVKDIQLENVDGFFRTVLSDGRWWLVTPAGHAFLSLGVNHVSFSADESVSLGYAPFELVNEAWFGQGEEGMAAFYEYALKVMHDLGFNTVGAWSGDLPGRIADRTAPPMPYSLTLGFAGSTDAPAVNGDGFPDVFDPAFAAGCLDYAKKSISKAMRADPYLIGYFTDNELKWWGEGRLFPAKNRSLADDFIGLQPDAFGKIAFRDFLFKDLGYTVATLNQAWGTAYPDEDHVLSLDKVDDDPAHPAISQDKAAFVGKIAEAYFLAVDAALDAADPNHLNLCARFAVAAPDGVVKAARHCDVLTINDYYTEGEELVDVFGADAAKRWKDQALLAGDGVVPKPAMLTEFGTRAADSGLPNGFGAGWTTQTQTERAAYYRRTLDKLIDLCAADTAFVVGFHWFEYADEPKLGRFDTEDGNYGLFAVDGSPYLTFQDGLESANEYVWDRLLGGDAPVLETPGGLDASVSADGVMFEWSPVDGASEYRVVVAASPAFPGLLAREDWGGAECDGPHDLIMTVQENRATCLEPLAAGKWFWTVSARNPGRAIASDWAPAASFDQTISCKSGHGKESMRCFEMPPPNEAPYNVDGTVSVTTLNFTVLEADVPDAVFIANSLGKNHPVNGGDGARVRLTRHYPEPLSGSPASDRFCPAAVVNTKGEVVSAATFVHVQHVTPQGQVVIDRPLDPNGTVEPFSCSFPVPSGDVPIDRKVYYIDTSDPLLPADVRIEVQLH